MLAGVLPGALRRVRTGALGVCLLGLLACGGPPAPAPVAAPTVPQGPEGSAFWRVPSETPDGARRGDVLRVQPRTDVPDGARGWNVVYVTEAATGALTYVSGEVYAPVAPSPAERPLAIWNHGTAGSQDSCAPSRNPLAERGAQPGGPLTTDADSRVPALMSLLARGYVVAMSDYQGLGTSGATEYLNGPTQAMASLDAARAARTLVEGTGASVVMYGFSQGGQTSLWAAHLAPDYAPDLRLLGVAAIAPAARHLDLSLYDLDIPQNAGYFISRMAGLAVGHPDLRLRDVLTPVGLELLDAQTWDCFAIFDAAGALDEPYARPAALEPGEPWRVRLEQNDAFLPIPATIPILVDQGDRDVDVPVHLTRALVADLCAAGSLVEYRQHADVNHMDMNDLAAPLMADWFDARFRGDAPGSTCPPATP